MDNNILKKLWDTLEDKLAIDIRVIDIRQVSTIGDYFVIVSGNNENHLKALAEAATEAFHKEGFKINHKEGSGASGWVLLDFFGVVVHIFDKETREFYNLEKLWNDGIVLTL